MVRRRRQEEHTNHEAWAIPYGDLLTLLLAFFVVMYAISSVNEGKYRVLSDSLSAAFRGTPHRIEPVQAGNPVMGAASTVGIGRVSQAGFEASARSMLERVPVPGLNDANTGRDDSVATQLASGVDDRQRLLDEIASAVEAAMQELILTDQLEVRRRGGWVEVDIRTDLLFASGSAKLGRAAITALERLADLLRKISNPIRVEGHTDDRPISTAEFPSNWELSAARAASVVRVLAARGVDPARLAVLGFGEFRPVQPNTTPEGRRANRRVLLVILGDEAAFTDASRPNETTPRPTAVAGLPTVGVLED